MRVVDCEQYTPEWWDARRGIPTASAFDKIVTPGGKLSESWKKYACQLIADEYDTKYGYVDQFASRAMENGARMEPEARRYYEFYRDATVQQVGFCMTDDGRYGSSPDSLVGDEGVLEVKCPESHTMVAYLIDGGLPKEYLPQCHGHLIVTGRKWCDFLAYTPGLPRLLVRVEPDEYTDKLRVALEDFWPKLVDYRQRIAAQREQTISDEIDRRGAQLDEKKDAGLKSFTTHSTQNVA